MKKNSKHLLVYGTYTQPESFVDGKGEGIYTYRMDNHSGK